MAKKPDVSAVVKKARDDLHNQLGKAAMQLESVVNLFESAKHVEVAAAADLPYALNHDLYRFVGGKESMDLKNALKLLKELLAEIDKL